MSMGLYRSELVHQRERVEDRRSCHKTLTCALRGSMTRIMLGLDGGGHVY